MHKRIFLGLMVVVLLLAALLRIYHLNQQGLWGDEGWSVEFSASDNPRDVVLALVPDLHPPLYFMTLAIWRDFAGSSEVAMRMLAVYSALLTVAIISRIAINRSAGILAALILALSDKHIVLSQEVRHYPTAFMMMALSSWVFLCWVKHPTRRATLLYAVVTIASVYVHYYTALIVLVQLAYMLINHRQRLPVFIFVSGLPMLAFLPWFFVAWSQLIVRPEGILHTLPLNWDTLNTLTIDFLGRPPILLLALLGLGVMQAFQRRSQAWYPLLWMAIPMAITVLVYPVVTVLTDRNMALLLLPIALLAGQGALWLDGRGRWLLASILLINGVASLDSYQIHPPWREMAVYVADHYPTAEPVFMDVRGGDKALDYHLRQLLPSNTQVVSVNQLRLDFGAYFLGVWSQYLDQNDGFWIAYWVNENEQWDVAAPLTAAGYVRTATRRFYHLGNPIDLYHYDKLPPLNEVITTFEGGIRLHRVKYPSVVTDVLPVSLWWSTVRPQSISYSVSVFLLDVNGRLVAQHDGAPQAGAAPTTAWQSDTVVLDSHAVDTSGLAAGTYHLAVKMYDSGTGRVLLAAPDMTEYVIVDSVRVATK